MKAEIISIGTELLLGTITDTNASYLARRLADLGIDCFYVSQVGDNESRIVDVMRRALERSDLVITTGGLGPTGDDLTREAISTLLGEAPVVVPELEERLRAFFARRGASMPDRNLKQATLIPSARTLNNPVGTAPGWLVRTNTPAGERFLVAMPGVPYEMKRMWEQEVEAWLRPLSPTLLVSRTLKILGLGESAIDEKVADLMNGSNPTLAPYAKQDGVHLRISAKAASERDAQGLIARLEEEVRKRLGDAVYGVDDETPASVVEDLLTEAGANIAVLEVGMGAVGAVSTQLAGYSGFAGAVVGSSPEEVAHLLTGERSPLSHVEAGRALLRKCGADLVLALFVTEESAAAGNSVKAIAEILLIGGSGSEETSPVTSKSEWTTSHSEVPRLVGLVALNLLRRWLLAQGRRMRQLDAV
jgi:nicotinamide-nucleotide amidase